MRVLSQILITCSLLNHAVSSVCYDASIELAIKNGGIGGSLLIHSREEANAVRDGTTTYLSVALLWQNYGAAKLLLEKGASPDFVRPDGNTYLHLIPVSKEFNSNFDIGVFMHHLYTKNKKNETPLERMINLSRVHAASNILNKMDFHAKFSILKCKENGILSRSRSLANTQNQKKPPSFRKDASLIWALFKTTLKDDVNRVFQIYEMKFFCNRKLMYLDFGLYPVKKCNRTLGKRKRCENCLISYAPRRLGTASDAMEFPDEPIRNRKAKNVFAFLRSTKLLLPDKLKNIDFQLQPSATSTRKKITNKPKNIDFQLQPLETCNTELMLASQNGDTKTVRVLLQMKANPNAINENGNTALMLLDMDMYKPSRGCCTVV